MRQPYLFGLPLILTLMSLSSPTTADTFQPRSYITGQQLYDACADDRTNCYMYVYGVLDQIMINDDATKACTFKSDGVAGDKAVNAVLAYITSHQDRMDWSAAALVQNAVRSKFPCGKKKPPAEPAQ